MTTIAPWPSTIPTKAAIISGIGRPVTFYTVYSSQACPDCSLDPITNTSTNSFCPTCDGLYWTDLYSGTQYTAHVTWKFSDQQQFETAGIVLKGDAQVKIMYSEFNDNIVENTKYVVVDDRQMDIDDITYRGATERDRIIVDLKERKRNE